MDEFKLTNKLYITLNTLETLKYKLENQILNKNTVQHFPQTILTEQEIVDMINESLEICNKL